MQLLIIEDEVKLANYLQKGLREEGFSVDRAHDGVAGLEAASLHRYDLILLDGMLPGLDGPAVLAALRQGQQTPVLMLTARGDVEDRRRLFGHRKPQVFRLGSRHHARGRAALARDRAPSPYATLIPVQSVGLRLPAWSLSRTLPLWTRLHFVQGCGRSF